MNVYKVDEADAKKVDPYDERSKMSGCRAHKLLDMRYNTLDKNTTKRQVAIRDTVYVQSIFRALGAGRPSPNMHSYVAVFKTGGHEKSASTLLPMSTEWGIYQFIAKYKIGCEIHHLE